MKRTLFLIECIIIAGCMVMLPGASLAQKTAKACEAEWKINRDAIKATGKKKKDFIAECRGTADSAATTSIQPATSTQSAAMRKTVKDCAAEWTANKAALQTSGKKRKDFIAECRGLTDTAATSRPASTAATETGGKKTLRDCVAEWTANKASLQASGTKRKDFVAQCRGLTKTAATTAAPIQPSSPVTADKAPSTATARDTTTAPRTGKKTVMACLAEWIANKAALQASGKTRKDFIADCRGSTDTTLATNKPASPGSNDSAPTPIRRDTSPVPDAASKSVNPRFSPTSSVGQYALESEAKGRCPGESVVWVNTKSKIYHRSKSRRYGKTKRGVYMCEKETAAAGFRIAKHKKRRLKRAAVASLR